MEGFCCELFVMLLWISVTLLYFPVITYLKLQSTILFVKIRNLLQCKTVVARRLAVYWSVFQNACSCRTGLDKSVKRYLKDSKVTEVRVPCVLYWWRWIFGVICASLSSSLKMQCINWHFDRLIDWSIDWLINWSIDWLIDRSINWSVDGLIDLLIDCCCVINAAS